MSELSILLISWLPAAVGGFAGGYFGTRFAYRYYVTRDEMLVLAREIDKQRRALEQIFAGIQS